jgi:ATP-dependent DNA helicase
MGTVQQEHEKEDLKTLKEKVLLSLRMALSLAFINSANLLANKY